MRQFWTRLGFVATAIAGYLITIMSPEASLFESVKAMSGIDWMGLVIITVPAFSSPTQMGNAFNAVKGAAK